MIKNDGLLEPRLEPFKIPQWPDQRLFQASSPVTPADVYDGAFAHNIRRLAITLMKSGGWGLAAPQVGWMKRVVVMVHPQQLAEIGSRTDGAQGDWKLDIVGLINPEIRERRGGPGRHAEGCLSFRGGVEHLLAHEDVDVECPDTNKLDILPLHVGKLRYVSLAARVIQHEVEHLDGKVFLNRMGIAQRHMFLKKLKKHRGAS